MTDRPARPRSQWQDRTRIREKKRWSFLRHAALKRDKFACRKCGVSGVRLECDHIIPVKDAPDKTYALDNLQILCVRCHAKKTAVEMGIAPLSKEKKDWRDRLTMGL